MKLFLVLICTYVSLFSLAESDTTIIRIEKIESLVEKTQQYSHASQSAWEMGRYDKALKYTEIGLEICEENNLVNEKVTLLNNRGIAFDFLGEYSSALTNFFEALRIQEKRNNNGLKAYIFSNIGLIYANQKNFDLALDYHRRSLKIRRELNDLSGISASLNNIAIVYISQDKFQDALNMFQECIRIDKEADDQRGLGDDYNNVGLCYSGLKMYKEAFDYFEKSLAIRKIINDPLGICQTETNIGTLHFEMGNMQQALDYFLAILPLAKQTESKELLRYCYEYLSKVENSIGNAEDALVYYKTFIAYRDSIDNSENMRIQTELEMQYHFDKEKERAKLIQEKKDEQAKVILYSVITGLILIVFFSLLLFKRWRQAQSQKQIIEEKNKLVERKNEEILDSITYAKRIQTAILPSKQLLNELIPNQFVLYLPKDIVAGDFYWLEKSKDKLFFAVADCTGHGVPGAMMSVVCHNALNRTVREFGLTEPGEILDKARDIIVSELAKNVDAVSDGMDISLCVLQQGSNTIKWAGAYNPLWIYKSNTHEVEEWKPNKQPIGISETYLPFTTHIIPVNTNDRIYLFTDGFADQFGGEKGKKLMKKSFQELLLKTSGLSTEEQKNALEQFYWDWKGELDQIDDVCVSCVVV